MLAYFVNDPFISSSLPNFCPTFLLSACAAGHADGTSEARVDDMLNFK